MKKKTLMDAMADIDDAFIEEAADPKAILKASRRAKYAKILSARRIGTLAACVAVSLGLVLAAPYLAQIGHVSPESDSSMSTPEVYPAINKQEAPLETISADAVDEMQESISVSHAMKEEARKEQAASESVSRAMKEEARKEQAASAAAQGSSKASSVKESTPDSPTTMSQGSISDAVETAPYAFPDAIYVFGGGVLYGIIPIAENAVLTDITIPAQINGERIEKIHTDFWSDAATWKTVTIPKDITKFGDFSALPKSVTVICAEGSAAMTVFAARGYTVQPLPQ